MDNECGWCKETAYLSCGKCNQVFYCGKDHQRAHWSIHKVVCNPYKIAEDEVNGRYLVSTKSIPAGTLVVKESPMVIGPTAKSSLVCLSCHAPVTGTKFYRCLKCRWPMCSQGCSENLNHLLECNLLKRDIKQCGVPQIQGETPRYDLILVLRCLLLRELNDSAWQKLQSMESHFSRRKVDGEPHHIAAIRYLTEVCKIDFDADTVHRVRGSIVTNTIKSTSPLGVTLRGLYPVLSLLNHSCYPNINLRSDKDHVLYIRATTDIKKGDPLLFSYVPIEDPLWLRQADLNEIYYFTCRCERCKDPSELSTYYSIQKCNKCMNGYLKQECTMWRSCTNCHNHLSSKEIDNQYEKLKESIENKKGTNHITLFLKDIADKCHKTHFLYFTALQKGLQILNVDNNSLEHYEKKKNILSEMLHIIDILEPGMTRKRGFYLLQYGKTTMDILKKKMTKKNKMDSVNEKLVDEALQIIREASQILELESPNSIEEKWKFVANGVLKELLDYKSRLELRK